MDPNEYLAAVRRDSAALAVAASSVDLTTPVPTCPGWAMSDLVAHIGQVQRWAAKHLEARARARLGMIKDLLPPAPQAAALIPWFREATDTLVATLEAIDPATPMWTFGGLGVAGFWFRRQAQEVSVHRWDAQRAAGAPEPIAALLAADGIDELLEMLPWRAAEKLVGSGETIHLHCTDVPGEWLATLSSQGLKVERAHAKGDVAARGLASDLDLFVWGRVLSDSLQVFGDAALLTRFQKLVSSL